jgi:hypothetical protein
LQIEENDIHVELPRATLGGLKKGPVEDLLRRVARDYTNLELERNRLSQALEQLGKVREQLQAPSARPAEKREDAAASGPETIHSRAVDPEPEPDNTPGTHGAPGSPHETIAEYQPFILAPSRQPDDPASVVLALAQCAAHELRESTRSECELMIRKTRARAQKLECDMEQSLAATQAELEELQTIRSELAEQMRSSLQALLHTFGVERSG